MKQVDWKRLRVIFLLMLAAFIMLFLSTIAQGRLSVIDGILLLLFEVVMIGFGFLVVELKK